jgi:hypothetical protein
MSGPYPDRASTPRLDTRLYLGPFLFSHTGSSQQFHEDARSHNRRHPASQVCSSRTILSESFSPRMRMGCP